MGQCYPRPPSSSKYINKPSRSLPTSQVQRNRTNTVIRDTRNTQETLTSSASMNNELDTQARYEGTARRFKLAKEVPDGYHTLLLSQHKKYKNWDCYLHRNGDWLYARHGEGKHFGHKLHLSFKKEQVPQAFDAVKKLLFSSESPISFWKIVNLNFAGFQQDLQEMLDTEKDPNRKDFIRAVQSDRHRVSNGMQLVLYLYPDDQKNRTFSEESAASIKNFVAALEDALIQEGIEPGLLPTTDVPVGRFRYTTYRRENEYLPKEAHVKDERILTDEDKKRVYPALEAQDIFKKLSS